MESRIEQTDPIQSAFAPLIGLPAWGAMKGHGSFVTLEFGDPHLSVSGPCVASPGASPKAQRVLAGRVVRPHGAWHLWIYCCHWRLIVKGEQTAWSEDPDAVLIKAVQEIDGQKLVSVEVNRSEGTSCFQFDLGARLETWPYGDGDNGEQWTLYAPDKQVLSYYADGHHAWEPSDTKPGEEH